MRPRAGEQTRNGKAQTGDGAALGPLRRTTPTMAPRNKAAKEPSTTLPGSATAATLIPAMSNSQLLRTLVEPPDMSATKRVQFPLGFMPLKEVNRAEGLVE